MLVTHDIGEAGYLADTICLLKSGRIVQRGTLDDFVRSPADEFVTRFINSQRSPLETPGVAQPSRIRQTAQPYEYADAS